MSNGLNIPFDLKPEVNYRVEVTIVDDSGTVSTAEETITIPVSTFRRRHF